MQNGSWVSDPLNRPKQFQLTWLVAVRGVPKGYKGIYIPKNYHALCLKGTRQQVRQPAKYRAYTLCLKKTALMLHTITSTQINCLVIFGTEMLLRDYAIERWFVIPPLLTTVSALPGKKWIQKIVFLVTVANWVFAENTHIVRSKWNFA